MTQRPFVIFQYETSCSYKSCAATLRKYCYLKSPEEEFLTRAGSQDWKGLMAWWYTWSWNFSMR